MVATPPTATSRRWHAGLACIGVLVALSCVGRGTAARPVIKVVPNPLRDAKVALAKLLTYQFGGSTIVHYAPTYAVFRGVLNCYTDPATDAFVGLTLAGGAPCSSQSATVDATYGTVTQVQLVTGPAGEIQGAVFTVTPDSGAAPSSVACGITTGPTITLLQPGTALAGFVGNCQTDASLALVTTSINATAAEGAVSALDASNATAPLLAVGGNLSALNGSIPFVPGASWLPPPRSLFAGLQTPNVIDGATGPQGFTGPAGPVGFSGLPGSPGVTGPTGTMGVTGPSGATGAEGTSGPTGASGELGESGATGATGL